QVHDAEFLQGTRITILDVPTEFDSTYDYARQAYVNLLDRLRELLAANDLPDIALTINGEPVRPMFSRRGGSVIRTTGSWGEGTTAVIKGHRRPPGDRQGAYYVRLGGLFQFMKPSHRGELKVDVVIDFTSTARPGHREYPV